MPPTAATEYICGSSLGLMACAITSRVYSPLSGLSITTWGHSDATISHELMDSNLLWVNQTQGHNEEMKCAKLACNRCRKFM
eukprot:1155737-Pelagomonas_calceolata.AAC.1